MTEPAYAPVGVRLSSCHCQRCLAVYTAEAQAQLPALPAAAPLAPLAPRGRKRSVDQQRIARILGEELADITAAPKEPR